MNSFAFANLSLPPRLNSNCLVRQSLNLLQLQHVQFHHKRRSLAAAVSRKKLVQNSSLDLLTEDEEEEEAIVVKTKTTRVPRKTTTRTRKKAVVLDPPDDSSSELVASSDDEATTPQSIEDSTLEEPPRTTPREAAESAASTAIEEMAEKQVKKRGRKPKKQVVVEVQVKASEPPDLTDNTSEGNNELLEIEELGKDEVGEDISDTYGWPPLVCCFGSAQHAFVPSGRPANRLVDYEIHNRMKDALWAPEKFVRAPGGSAGSVAIALAALGGKVALMGKLGGDDYGQAMLCYLNTSNVQTRSVRVDNKRSTAKSVMKIGKRGRLRMTCVRPCAEDALSKSDINIDVLKEAKMLYVNTHSLLEKNMRSVALETIKIAKRFGAVVFYDVNLPLPMWHSGEETTKTLIKDVWELSDVIEVTKQELEFLCGVEEEEFDTKNNSESKFVHYEYDDVVAPLWHDNLKVLFVTNGTSKIHYYTKDFDGSVHGMEDPPVTPFTQDMSASGDGVVAALMRMLTVQPHLINDRGYLEHSIKYAIDCGVTDQWILAPMRGFPPKEGQEDMAEPDDNGIVSLMEKEFRTILALEPVS